MKFDQEAMKRDGVFEKYARPTVTIYLRVPPEVKDALIIRASNDGVSQNVAGIAALQRGLS